MICVHFPAVDFLRPMKVCSKRKDLRGWQQEVIVSFKKAISRLVNRCPIRRSSVDVHGAEPQAALNFPLSFGLQLLALSRVIIKVPKIAVPKIACGQPMPQSDKGRPPFFSGKVRLRLLDGAADAFESFERITTELE